MKKVMAVSLALVLAMTQAARAEQEWGILAFAEEQGRVVAETLLHKRPEQTVSDTALVEVNVAEALRDGEKLYLALTVTPKQSGTLVMPSYASHTGLQMQDINEPGGMQIMDHEACAPELSVKAYAKANGFARVASISIPACMAEEPCFLEYAAFDHQQDGTLRMLLQYARETQAASWKLSAEVECFDDNGLLAHGKGEKATIEIKLPIE